VQLHNPKDARLHLSRCRTRPASSQYSLPGDVMTVTRLIVKYPNRRMYDLNESRYITLDDIRSFVTARDEIKITDKKSQLDITNHILLKVIAEQEDHDEPVLTREFLLKTILSYGAPGGQGQRLSGTDPNVVRSPPARLLSNSP
jgi:polyhydroxyalkanoate synthesis repressor PhaR